jgi:hypothetical protein
MILKQIVFCHPEPVEEVLIMFENINKKTQPMAEQS